MTYVVFRHENAFGNTCEQVINLASAIRSDQAISKTIDVAVEHVWQKDLVELIPGSQNFNINVLGEELNKSFKLRWENLDRIIDQPVLPSYYAIDKFRKYNAGWEYLKLGKEPLLNKLHGQNFDVVIQFRVKDSWTWRGESKNPDPSRFVKESSFVEIISKLCESGLKVARIGNKSSTEIFFHENFLDTTLLSEFSLKSQVGLISQAKVFVSSDSSIWPLGPALGVKTLITNITSVFEFLTPIPYLTSFGLYLPHAKKFARKTDIAVIKPYIFDWIGPSNKYLLKKLKTFFGFIVVTDNSAKDIVREILDL